MNFKTKLQVFLVQDLPRIRWKIFVGFSGLLMLVSLGKVYSSKLLVSRSLPGRGMILKVEQKANQGETWHCPVIDYQLEGSHQSLQFPPCTPQPLYQQGEVLSLLIDLDEKTGEHRLHINSPANLYYSAFAWLFFSILFLSMAYVDYRKFYRLRYYGVLIHAKVAGVTNMDKYRKQHRNRFFIEAVWEDPMTQKIYSFKSEGLHFDPSQIVKDQLVEILLDPKNPKRYEFKIAAEGPSVLK